jgi:hypothetical protein
MAKQIEKSTDTITDTGTRTQKSHMRKFVDPKKCNHYILSLVGNTKTNRSESHHAEAT